MILEKKMDFWLDTKWINNKLDVSSFVQKENKGDVIIYEVQEKETKEKRALKIQLIGEKDWDVFRKIKKEINYHFALKHEHIGELFDFDIEYFEKKKIIGFYMLMEFGEELLYERIKQNKISYKEMLQALADILEASLFSNEKRISHLDLKSDNIMKIQDGYKLFDWGSSIKLEKVGTNKYEENKKGCDLLEITPPFASPEVWECSDKSIEKDINFSKNDCYAIGVIMLQIMGLNIWELHGKKMIGDENDHDNFVNEFLLTNQNKDNKAKQEYKKDIGKNKFGLLIANMLKHDRKKRFDLRQANEFMKNNFLNQKEYGLREPKGQKILVDLKEWTKLKEGQKENERREVEIS